MYFGTLIFTIVEHILVIRGFMAFLQVPQIILDDARLKNKPCNIVITQPRRIAARQVATEVLLLFYLFHLPFKFIQFKFHFKSISLQI